MSNGMKRVYEEIADAKLKSRITMLRKAGEAKIANNLERCIDIIEGLKTNGSISLPYSNWTRLENVSQMLRVLIEE